VGKTDMLIRPETLPGTIVAPDGTPVTLPTRLLTADEAKVIRAYKKIKLKYGFREENHCNACSESRDRSDGMRGFTTDEKVLYECRCRLLYFDGASY